MDEDEKEGFLGVGRVEIGAGVSCCLLVLKSDTETSKR